MPDNQKSVLDMSPEEYRSHKAEIIRNQPGMTAAERADLVARRGGKQRHVKGMTASEYEAAVRKIIRGDYT